MAAVKRRSPVVFPGKPAEIEVSGGWEVVVRYERESELSPVVVDLSHKAKWMVQGKDLQGALGDTFRVGPRPGDAHLEKGCLVSRLGSKQAVLWELGQMEPFDTTGSGFTDVTEGYLLLALAGPGVFSIAEKLTALDLLPRDRKPPFVLQGPFSHVPCQVAVLNTTEDTGAFLVACSRGYARDMVHAVMEAGGDWGLRPAGERSFQRFLA